MCLFQINKTNLPFFLLSAFINFIFWNLSKIQETFISYSCLWFTQHVLFLQDNYSSFCNLDSKGTCYRYEVSLSGPAIELHNCMAKLLAHPLQRPFQSHASYSLLEDDDPEDTEATV